MRGRADCPKCFGRGVVIEGRFPDATAHTCECAKGPEILGVPKRFVNADLATFKDWWWAKNDLDQEKLLRQFGDATTIIQNRQDLGKGSEGLVKRLAGFIGDGKPTPERLAICGLPKGTGTAMREWAGNLGGENLWIYGPARSGKTSLAVALLKEHCVRTNSTGAYAATLGVSDALKTFYSRNLGAGTWEEKAYQVKDALEIYGPLMEPDCLLLDGIDCMAADKRVVDNFMAVLARRHDDAKITMFTSTKSLIAGAKDGNHPFKVGEPALVEITVNRLVESYGIEMIPALASALDG